MINNSDINRYLDRMVQRLVPRLLTQLDRDPDSPTYGCFDRDFWHYKIRDFSSIVLQQGALVLQSLSASGSVTSSEAKTLTAWVGASLRFWAGQQLPSGSFNEYYPHEEGFPPTAFSLFSVVQILEMRGFAVQEEIVAAAVQKSVDWLLSCQEKQASNQEATALAAISLAAQVAGVTVDKERLESRWREFFNSQSEEGWFPEYGGADIGYLSVTIDALWSYFEFSGDERAGRAMDLALQFISSLISVSGETPVMINSRNTDYLAPYGIIRLAEKSPLARRVIDTLFTEKRQGFHFLESTDDRYLCHYLYHSCFRGAAHLSAMTDDLAELPCEIGGEFYHPKAGLFILHQVGSSSIYVAAAKGGVCYLYNKNGISFADYGWRQRLSGGRVALTHWQNPASRWSHRKDDGACLVDVSGAVTSHKWMLSTPFRHFALRCASLLMGKMIIARLKKRMIFSAVGTGIAYTRMVRFQQGKITITDTFTGKDIQSFSPEPAPPYSLRHVASAANFSPEDFPQPGRVEKLAKRTAGSLVITATIALNGDEL